MAFLVMVQQEQQQPGEVSLEGLAVGVLSRPCCTKHCRAGRPHCMMYQLQVCCCISVSHLGEAERQEAQFQYPYIYMLPWFEKKTNKKQRKEKKMKMENSGNGRGWKMGGTLKLIRF